MGLVRYCIDWSGNRHGALFGAATELLSPGEYDTVTVPVAITVVLLLLSNILR